MQVLCYSVQGNIPDVRDSYALSALFFDRSRRGHPPMLSPACRVAPEDKETEKRLQVNENPILACSNCLYGGRHEGTPWQRKELRALQVRGPQ